MSDFYFVTCCGMLTGITTTGEVECQACGEKYRVGPKPSKAKRLFYKLLHRVVLEIDKIT